MLRARTRCPAWKRGATDMSRFLGLPRAITAATAEGKKALAAAKQRVRELFAELFEEVMPSHKKR